MFFRRPPQRRRGAFSDRLGADGEGLGARGGDAAEGEAVRPPRPHLREALQLLQGQDEIHRELWRTFLCFVCTLYTSSSSVFSNAFSCLLLYRGLNSMLDDVQGPFIDL